MCFGLPNNSCKPITNTAWVRARLCKLQKGCTWPGAASDKVYQLLAHGRWFSPGTPASSTTKTGRHDIAEILLNVELKHQKSKQKNHEFATIYTTVFKEIHHADILLTSNVETNIEVSGINKYIKGIFRLQTIHLAIYNFYFIRFLFCSGFVNMRELLPITI